MKGMKVLLFRLKMTSKRLMIFFVCLDGDT